VPTKLTAFAHTAANANDDARIRTEVPNEGLVHPLVVEPGFLLPTQRFIRGHHARTPQALRRHAERVIADAMAGFRVYECTVQGHGERINEQMTMYAVNSLAHVRDDFHRINETMLITSVDFSGSREGGQRTTLRMVPKGAIKVFPDSDGE
jgi:prophage tail gpP-like protein